MKSRDFEKFGILKSCDFEFIKGKKTDVHYFILILKMANLPLLPPKTTFNVEGKIAHLFYDGNTGQKRDLIEDFQSYPWEKKYILAQMDCLTDSMITSVEDAMEYHALGDELDRVKRKESKDEKIIRAILMKMGCLIVSMVGFEEDIAEDTEEYLTLSEEMEKVEEKESKGEKILHALDGLNLEKIYIYE